jgi:hypothetical protein
MKTTISCRPISRIVLMAALVLTALPAYSQSGGSSAGSGGTSSGGHVGAPKPGTSQPADQSLQGMERLSQMPNQTQAERAKALEERLQSGQMDKPIAQGQISDRLEQFYRRAADK